MGNRRLRIKEKLDELKDDQSAVKFQRLVVQLLKPHYPDIKPMPPHKDMGTDATATKDGRQCRILCSHTNTLQKLRSDCDKHKDDPNVQIIVFCTWPAVTRKKQQEWRNAIKQDYGWDLEVYEEESLLDLAMMEANCFVVSEYLGIQPPPRWRPALSASPPSMSISTIQVVNKLVAKNVEYAVSLLESCKLQEALTELKNILSEFNECLSAKDLARVHTNIASVYLELRSFDESENHLRIALGLEKNDIRLYTNLSVLLMARSEYNMARTTLEQAFANIRPDARAMSVYSNILWALREDEAAMDQAELAIQADPNVAQGHLVKALVLRGHAMFEEALAELETACHLDPEYYFAHGIRLETLAYLATKGRSPVTIEDLHVQCKTRLLEIEHMPCPLPRFVITAQAVLHSALGLILIVRQQWDNAADALLKQLKFRDEPIGHQNLGMVYLAQKKLDDADAEFRKAVELGVDDPRLLHNIAFRCLQRFQEGEFNELPLLIEAKNLFTNVQAKLPDDIETGFLEAAIIHAESEYTRSDKGIGRGKALLDRVIQDKECPVELSTKAHINLQQLEKLEKVIADWRRV